ncbi:adenosylcobinamide-phosphate synthase CbiB [Draconibacterium halophilum]|uniref:Cobalamin biosynthesis protein CobD n=1 Tax=Draconibacterium halophilum TaxID=2706887 RepID=A0A6C0REQ5_9BACT|nr:adenosylcobinamide-phosphate synthase CbiB [Draconibacterium halophilum]QIA08994.1 cobalamin biosynthesis protein CobD [Draconibacterium halophilum]
MSENLEIIVPLLAGFTLDCLIGDPHFLPHPIRLFGKAILFGETKLNRGTHKKIKGAILSSILIISTFFIFKLGLLALSEFQNLFLIVSSIFVFYGLANRSLIQEALRVIFKLEKEGLESGRVQLSLIVGRETAQLNENQIRTAVLETLAENLSDGVIAPLFFYTVGGVPAMFAYKMANTLDSMIGYKNERYKEFGFFAAKLDDVLNFIPARLTAVLMATISFSFRGFKFIFRYGKKHASPNAGYPEAALAGILDCRFGGTNRYHGKVINKPIIGENSRLVTKNDVYKSCVINGAVALVFLVCFIVWLV